MPPSRELIRKKIGFEPRGPNQAAFVNTTGRWCNLLGGERGGKSFVCGRVVLPERTFEFDRPILAWIVGHTYRDCVKEYEYALESYQELGVLANAHSPTTPNRSWIMQLNDGSVIKTLSAGDIMSIGREEPDIILGCEASQLGPEAVKRLVGRVTANDGYLFLSGTLESNFGWYPKLHERWKSAGGVMRAYNMPTWERYELGIDDPRFQQLREENGEDYFRRRIAAIVDRPAGVVFPEFDPQMHVGMPNGEDVEYVPGQAVEIAVDPGFRLSAHALLAVQHDEDGLVRVIDEIYSTKYNTELMIEAAMSKPWWKDVTGGVIDVQATKNQTSTIAAADVWLEKTGLVLESEYVLVQDGIDRMKSFLTPNMDTLGPRMVIAYHCQGILSEFGMVESPLTQRDDVYMWATDKDGRITGAAPRDRYNHSIKALTYWLIVRFGYVGGSYGKRGFSRGRVMGW